jgi:hypothetical protein
MKLATNTGMLLLGIWLVLTGALPLLNINVDARLMGILAVAAGAMILANK